MIIHFAQQIDDTTAVLLEEECRHCAKVLRKKVNDEVFVTDGLGALYNGHILSISKHEVRIKIHDLISQTDKGHVRGIAISPTKNIDRFEWFLEKATEIGITDIYPILTKNSERKIIKPARLQKILVSGMKQSKNFHISQLHDFISLSDFINQDFSSVHTYIAHCMEPDAHLHKLYTSRSDAVVLIGPEGDFTADEVETVKAAGWQEVSLGTSRLRTETAGLVACHLLNL